MTPRALVCGAGGSIGGHLAERLHAEGYWVRGVDVEEPRYRDTALTSSSSPTSPSPAIATEPWPAGPSTTSTSWPRTWAAWSSSPGPRRTSCAPTSSSAPRRSRPPSGPGWRGTSCPRRCASTGTWRPASPPWTRTPLTRPCPTTSTAGRSSNRNGWSGPGDAPTACPPASRCLQNTYGPYGAWRGGREKAAAAICREVAEAPDGGTIEAFGDGTAVRSYIYVDDLVDGIRLLTGSDVEEPTNIGSRQYVAVAELVEAVASVAGKSISVRWVEGPVGVRSRNFSNDRIESLGFVTRHSLLDGLRATCPRVEQQAGAARAAERR